MVFHGEFRAVAHVAFDDQRGHLRRDVVVRIRSAGLIFREIFGLECFPDVVEKRGATAKRRVGADFVRRLLRVVGDHHAMVKRSRRDELEFPQQRVIEVRELNERDVRPRAENAFEHAQQPGGDDPVKQPDENRRNRVQRDLQPRRFRVIADADGRHRHRESGIEAGAHQRRALHRVFGNPHRDQRRHGNHHQNLNVPAEHQRRDRADEQRRKHAQRGSRDRRDGNRHDRRRRQPNQRVAHRAERAHDRLRLRQLENAADQQNVDDGNHAGKKKPAPHAHAAARQQQQAVNSRDDDDAKDVEQIRQKGNRQSEAPPLVIRLRRAVREPALRDLVVDAHSRQQQRRAFFDAHDHGTDCRDRRVLLPPRRLRIENDVPANQRRKQIDGDGDGLRQARSRHAVEHLAPKKHFQLFLELLAEFFRRHAARLQKRARSGAAARFLDDPVRRQRAEQRNAVVGKLAVAVFRFAGVDQQRNVHRHAVENVVQPGAGIGNLFVGKDVQNRLEPLRAVGFFPKRGVVFLNFRRNERVFVQRRVDQRHVRAIHGNDVVERLFLLHALAHRAFVRKAERRVEAERGLHALENDRRMRRPPPKRDERDGQHEHGRAQSPAHGALP